MPSLFQELSSHLEWKKSRINCLLSIIFSLINYNHVGVKHLSLRISNNIKYKSKVQHIYRFFREQIFNYDIIAKIIMSFFHQEKYILTMERTNWKLGKTHINILFLCIAISTAIIIKQGLIKNESLPIKIKKHKRSLFSLFSYCIQEIKDNLSKLVFRIGRKIRDIFQIHKPHIACLEIIAKQLL